MRRELVLVGAAAVLSLAAAAAASGGSGIPSVTTCKPFVGAKWVNPYPPHENGDHFQVQVSGKAFTCATADAYTKKFIVEKITPEKSMPGDGAVADGPKGYNCTSGISYIKTAYQGSCHAAKQTLDSSWFDWGPYNDS
jgi:hypothetical protein